MTRMQATSAVLRWATSTVRGLTLALVLMSAAGVAHATPEPLPGVFSGSHWEASVDKATWVPVDSPHYNPITKPALLIDGVLDWVKPRGSLMWHPRVGDEFPDDVYFRLVFATPAAGYWGNARAWIAADDWMELEVNGSRVADYVLDEHQDPVSGQPLAELVFFDIDRTPGALNTIVIHAANALLYQWVFFDADNIMTREFTRDERIVFLAVPEPATLLLAMSAALIAWRSTKRRTH